jgi:hypothetical protein
MSVVRDKLITIDGRRWLLRYLPIRSSDGECDQPGSPRKSIRIARRLQRFPRALAETLVHEILHAHLWDLGEEKIDAIASDTARILEGEHCLREERSAQ